MRCEIPYVFEPWDLDIMLQYKAKGGRHWMARIKILSNYDAWLIQTSWIQCRLLVSAPTSSSQLQHLASTACAVYHSSFDARRTIWELIPRSIDWSHTCTTVHQKPLSNTLLNCIKRVCTCWIYRLFLSTVYKACACLFHVIKNPG